MFDDFILFVDQYAIYLVLIIAAYKILHIVFYKGFQPYYIVTTFFVVFSGTQVSEAKHYRQRFLFRQVHNVVTVVFYVVLILWLTIHLILYGV